MYHRLPTVHPSTNIDIETININKPIVSNEFGDMVYWSSTSVRDQEHMLSVIDTSQFMGLDVAPEPHIPIPEWNKAIDTELIKFETNS
jgi:hypothetical protein